MGKENESQQEKKQKSPRCLILPFSMCLFFLCCNLPCKNLGQTQNRAFYFHHLTDSHGELKQ